MDHNLDDSLNLESAIGNMDFDHSGVVVNQEDITLETTGHENDIQMEFEPIEEQPMLMDTGNEEIIVSDFMNDQFALQEYTTQDEGTTGASETVDVNQLNMLSQSESMIDLQFEPETLTQTVAHEVPLQPKYIQVKAAVALPRTIKKDFPATSTMPRQVPIAPKPPKLTISKPPFTTGKQFAIAPKPVTLVANKGASLVKKMSLTGVVQSGSKTGNSVLTQIGKQLVMLPAGGGQKIKLVSSGSGMSMQYVRANADQAQLISAKQITGTNVQKPLVGKFIVQAGQSNISSTDTSNQPAMITKLMSGVSTAPHTRYVMQQKTVPINIGGTKVLLTSPTKQGMKFKKQIISIQSPTPKLLPATTQGAPTTKKVVITANPSQNVILKPTGPPKTAQVGTKEGQRTQLHQISVPGKGIQYFRLITNPASAAQKPQTPVSLPPKSFVLTDTKGNIIYMPGQSLVSDEPPPLVTTTGSTTAPKMTSRPQKKLIRIAPIAAKPALPATQQSSRSSQSLLAPLSPIESTVEQIDHTKDLLEERVGIEDSGIVGQDEFTSSSDESRDTKASMRALLSEVVGGTVDHYQPQEQQDELRTHMHGDITMQEVEVEFERQQTPVEEDPNSMDALDSNHRSEDHPLIVIPSNYGKQAQIRVSSEGSRRMHEPKEYANVQVNIEEEPVPYLSPKQSHAPPSEPDLVPGDLSLRPRKACNCTKSQCLKLYCDCFANGEFCNRCNCNNCHNNLENEELRQKAIRACLDRNPNAFRPKIGKAKSGGPDIIRRHNKGCNCKRSGCLKNYCECYEAKIACTTMCKCVGCRNVEETLERRRDAMRLRDKLADPLFRPAPVGQMRQPCSFMTSEVIEAVCQCLIAAAVSGGEGEGEGEGDGDEESGTRGDGTDPIGDVIEEFARCLQDIISASHQSTSVGEEGQS